MPEIKVQKRYVVSTSGCMIFLQIVFAVIVIGLILWEEIKLEDKEIAKNYKHFIVKGEEYTLLVTFIAIVVNILFLLVFCLTCYEGCTGCPCFSIASFYYGLSVLAWLAAGGVEVYAAVMFKDHDVMGIKIPHDQLDALFRRRAAAAGICFATGLTYILSFQQSRVIVHASYEEV